jgi:hypothetical protein
MGMNPDDIDHITLAERVGLGTNDATKITVVGATIDETKRPFRYTQPLSTTNPSSYGQSNRTWLLRGHFSTTGISDPMNHPFIADEASAAPAAGTDGWSEPVYFIEDQILLHDYYSALGTQSAVSYAFSYFTSPAAQAAELWIGSDEALKVYLNGVVVYNYTGTRTFAGNEFYKEIAPITIQQGVNRLLVKAYQGTGKYTFSLNICEAQANTLYKGNRVPGLKFSTVETGTNVADGGAKPASTFRLHGNYPNPFNPKTVIRYQLPVPSVVEGSVISGQGSVVSNVELAVYDLLGREVAVLVRGKQSPGQHAVAFDATGLPSGVYLYRLRVGMATETRKMVLTK